MKIQTFLVVLFLSVIASMPVVAGEEFGGIEFSPPKNWGTTKQDGSFILAPNESVDELIVVFMLSPATSLGGKNFRSWFEEGMAAGLGAQSKVLAEGQVNSQEAGAFKRLTTARAVQDSTGALRFQLFYAISFEGRAALVMGVAAGQKALDKYSAEIRGFYESLTFSAAKAAPAAGAPSASVHPSGGGEGIPQAGLVDGRPQGLFIGVSVLSGNPVFLLFLNNGMVFSQLPPGGLNRIDWAALAEKYPNSSGQWSVSNGRLTLRWRNGGVWEDAILPTPRGMKFNGKSYSAAAKVDLSRISGVFEGSQSTAWLNVGGGPSLTRVTKIVLDGRGGFSFDSATGGDVGNAVAYGSSASSGTVTVEGYDAVFRLKDGGIMRAGAVRFPDDDSFILNGTYYVKQ